MRVDRENPHKYFNETYHRVDNEKPFVGHLGRIKPCSLLYSACTIFASK